MIVTVYIAPDEREFDTLPARWGNTSPVTEAWALSHGWIKEQRTIPDPPVYHTYSKLRLYDALVAEGIWDAVIAAIDAAGQRQRYDQAVNLSTDYQPFVAILGQLRAAFGDEVTDRVLAAAEI